jgi:hypothetical protein
METFKVITRLEMSLWAGTKDMPAPNIDVTGTCWNHVVICSRLANDTAPIGS